MRDLTKQVSIYALKQAYHAELQNILGHREIMLRLDRAYELLTRDERYTILYDDLTELFSVESPNDTYEVSLVQRSCTCPDSALLCKHRFACKLLLDALALQEV